MNLQQAERKRAKIKMALQGPSGSGKTYSSLLIAYGLVGDWRKIAVVDTESQSSHLYAHLGEYNVLPLEPPFSPERYIKAIKTCEAAGIESIVIDSISHEWEGAGGILDVHGNMTGNSFANWAHVTPRHNRFVDAILQTPVHIIATIRSKQDYVLSDKNGKMVPEKVGLKGITRDGMDYEFTILMELGLNHHARITKDRTNLFTNDPEFQIETKTGERIATWCNEGTSLEEVRSKIQNCMVVEELLELYNQHPEYREQLLAEFSNRKTAIQQQTNDVITIKNQNNGIDNQQ